MTDSQRRCGASEISVAAKTKARIPSGFVLNQNQISALKTGGAGYASAS